jgi:hypothetical protein
MFATRVRVRQHEPERGSGRVRSGRAAFVSVVQTANFWQFHHSAEFGRLNSARNRCVLVEGQMSARASVQVDNLIPIVRSRERSVILGIPGVGVRSGFTEQL